MICHESTLTVPYNEEGKGVIQYRLIDTPDLDGESQVWSLVIIKLLSDGEVETDFTYDLSRDRSRAEKLTQLLCRNAVTPCCAAEVIEDLLISVE